MGGRLSGAFHMQERPMEAVLHDARTLTELDHARLSRLTRELDDAEAAKPLVELLGDADLVPSREVGPDIVTMYSEVLVTDVVTQHRRKLTLCYPGDADPARGRVSVLSPVGASLLGSRVGSVVHWRSPNGEERAAEVLGLHFQPEQSGDYTT
jgi:regulator of nucleoside diphosphate kinase